MNRTYLLALLVSLGHLASAQTVTLPYNPDVDESGTIGVADILEPLSIFGSYFTPSEVMVDDQTLTQYIEALQLALEEANADTVPLPMLPGTAPGEMLYWDGVQWTLLPVGDSGNVLYLDGATPTWTPFSLELFGIELTLGCTDTSACNFQGATIEDGTCQYLDACGVCGGFGTDVDADGICDFVDACVDTTASNFDDPANGPCVGSCAPVDFDGYTYAVVEIGDQCWFAENLRTTVYANGDVIPVGLTDGEWTSTTAGATAVYGEGSSTCNNASPDINACDEAQSLAEYGRLYNWYAVDDARGLCPAGWHVPTDGEWTELEDYITSLGFAGMEGTALKSTMGWFNNGHGTDDFGFSALPGGYRSLASGGFDNAGHGGYWWSSSPDGGSAWYRLLSFYYPDISRGYDNPRGGFSVRCLRDAE